MMVLSETMVFTPNGREVSTQACIIGIGPIATTRSGRSRSSTSCSAAVTKPSRPALPSSVHRISSSAHAPSLSAQNTRSLLRKPTMHVVRLPASLNARSCGKIGATPRPPPTSTTWPTGSMCCGRPKGPTKSANSSPASYLSRISRVVAPSDCTTTVIVPRSRSKSATVSGMRSPASSSRSMTKWPGCADCAMSGASTSHRKVCCENFSTLAMRYIGGLASA